MTLIELSELDTWVECPTCWGERTVLDDSEQFDIECPNCQGDGGWEQ